MKAFGLVLMGVIGVIGCQSRTELMIGVATDIKAPDLIDTVELNVAPVSNGVAVQSQSWTITGIPDEPYNLPGSYGVYSDGDETPLQITLTGMKGETPVVSRRAIVNLVDGQTLFYRIGLTAECIGYTGCPQGEDCVEGSCRDVNVDASQLPDYDDSLTTTVTCTSRVTYLDTSTGLPMKAAADAASCPPSLCVEGTCLLPPSTAGVRDVAGSEIDSQVVGDQVTAIPQDLSMASFAALVPSGSGAATTIAAQTNADGTFAIANVPAGTYYLETSPTTFWVNATSLWDFGSVFAGDATTTSSTVDTYLAYDATGLTPWVSTDSMIQMSMQANQEFTIDMSAGSVSVGSTTFQTTVDNYPGFHLLSNDDLELFQMRTEQAPGGASYQVPIAMLQAATPVSLVDGGSDSIPGDFEPLAPDQSLSLVFPGSQWAAAAGDNGTNPTLLNPTATRMTSDPTVSIEEQLGGTLYGEISGAPIPQLVISNLPTTDTTIAGLAYPTPKPALVSGLGSYVQVSDTWTASYLLPGTTTPATQFVYVGSVATATQPAPPLGPVRNAAIKGGASLFTAQSGVGTTPTITWDPPAAGIATEYNVAFYQLQISGSLTVANYVCDFTTIDTSLTVLPNLLTAGQPYFIVIYADDTPNPAAPYRNGAPWAYSLISSAIITL